MENELNYIRELTKSFHHGFELKLTDEQYCLKAVRDSLRDAIITWLYRVRSGFEPRLQLDKVAHAIGKLELKSYNGYDECKEAIVKSVREISYEVAELIERKNFFLFHYIERFFVKDLYYHLRTLWRDSTDKKKFYVDQIVDLHILCVEYI